MTAPPEVAVPERVRLRDALLLRARADHAELVAVAVEESLEHLRPFMPWANEQSTDPVFQRDRLTGIENQWAAGETFEYFVFDPDAARVLGGIGLMTRRGPGTMEIGYWLHVEATGRGIMTDAARALTNVGLRMPGVETVLVYCDAANVASAAIPRRLGFTLLREEPVVPVAPAETGRHQVWARTQPLDPVGSEGAEPIRDQRS